VKFKGEVTTFNQAISGSFEPISMTENNNETIAKVKIPPGSTSNDLLKTILPVGIITGFAEILPSMSEIFISAVKGIELIQTA
jgi:hypothetical protein